MAVLMELAVLGLLNVRTESASKKTNEALVDA